MKHKDIKVMYTSDKDFHHIPMIRFTGKWLEEIGFHVGDKISIEYDEGRIVITK